MVAAVTTALIIPTLAIPVLILGVLIAGGFVRGFDAIPAIVVRGDNTNWDEMASAWWL